MILRAVTPLTFGPYLSAHSHPHPVFSCHPPSGQACDECPWLTSGETEPMRGRSWPSSIHSQGGIPSWVSWLQSQSLSYQLPLPHLMHYLWPITYLLQSPRCRLQGCDLAASPGEDQGQLFLSHPLSFLSSFAASLGLGRLLGCGPAGPLFPPRRAVSSLPSQSTLSPSSWLFEQSSGSQHSPGSPSPYHSPSLSRQCVCARVDVVCMCMCVMREGHECMFYMGWARGMGLSSHS